MNAIIQRELAATLRSWKAVLLQAIFLACLGGLVLLRWPSEAHADLGGVESRQVFRVFGYGLTIGLMLVSPAFPATSIVRERLQGTLALLLNSPIHPVSMVLGKLVGSLGFVLLLIVLSFPAAAACFAMGGIALTEQLGGLYLALSLLALQYASIGLFVSSMVRSTDAALRMTYGVILVLAVGALGPFHLLKEAAWAGPGLLEFASGLRSLSPFPAIMGVLGDSGISSGAAVAGQTDALRFFTASGILSLICLAATGWRLGSRPMDRARDAGRITDEQALKTRILRRVMYLWFFDPQRRSGLIAPWQNPVMIKEQRCRPLGRANWMMRLIGGYFVLSFALVLGATTMSQSQGVAAVLAVIAIMQVSLIVLLAPSLASGLISGERESRGWQLLQMTPLSPLTIVVGKLLSASLPLALIMLATLPAYGVLLAIDPAQAWIAISAQLTLLLFACMAIIQCAGIGSLFRNTAAATAAAYGVVAAICVGTLFVWLGRDAPFTAKFVELALTPNPLAATFSIIGVTGFSEYRLAPGNWYVMGVMTVVSAAVLLLQVTRLGRPR
ncbi:MAG: ABC transporter permease [Planctomycetes bacterium]|nr:ABC transporter permease [Planctomycetota bacterium]